MRRMIVSTVVVLSIFVGIQPAHAGKLKALAWIIGLAGAGIVLSTIEVNAADFKIQGDIMEAHVTLHGVFCPNIECDFMNGAELPNEIDKKNIVSVSPGRYQLSSKGQLADGRYYMVVGIGQIDKKAVIINKK